ncbi:hypothetical protein Ancab_031818 [Ancistrocladus abbreviatus]
MKGFVPTLLLLLLGMANLASAASMNRRLLITEASGLATQTPAKQYLSVEEDTTGQMGSANGDPDLNNHHGIPSQSWDSGGQNPHGSTDDAQSRFPIPSEKNP